MAAEGADYYRSPWERSCRDAARVTEVPRIQRVVLVASPSPAASRRPLPEGEVRIYAPGTPGAVTLPEHLCSASLAVSELKLAKGDVSAAVHGYRLNGGGF